MNKIHSKVWNKALGQLVVASEFASSDSTSGVRGTGMAAPSRRTHLAVASASMVVLMGAAGSALAQDAPWTLGSPGSADVTIGAGGSVVVQGGANINVGVTGTAGDATLDIALDPDLEVESVTAGTTRLDTSGVAVGAHRFDATGLTLDTGPSVTINGINAGNRVITGVADGTANGHAVNLGQLDGVRATAEDAIAAAQAARAAADAAGWTLSAGGNQAEIGSGGTVTFAGDGNISVALTGVADNDVLTVTLAPNLTVTSITTGNATLDNSGLRVAGGANGPVTVSVSGIDAGGGRISNIQGGTIAAGNNDAVTGGQIFDLFIESGAGGVRYFRALSARADSRALGQESIAIGPTTLAEGTSSFAAGDGAATSVTAEGAIALGQGASAGTPDGAVSDGAGSIAIGRESRAGGNRTLALGDGAHVENERVSDALAIGADARVSGLTANAAVAVGYEAHASAVNATALGAGAAASGDGAAAVGYGATASGGGSVAVGDADATAGNAISVGTGAYVGTENSIALGTGAGIGTEGNAAGDRTDHIAIGTGTGQQVVGNQNTAIGYRAGSGVQGDENIAIGSEAGRALAGNNNISIGVSANSGAGGRAQAIAIGDNTAAGSDSVALGSGARADGSETLALGKDAVAGSNGVALGAHATAEGSHIALGRNSAARASDVNGVGYLTGSAANVTAVSVGNSNPGQAFQRRIVNVADGAQGYDAVNVRQLHRAQQAVANLVGGAVTVGANGSFEGYVIELTDQNNVVHRYTTVAEAINAVSSGEVSVLPGNAAIYNPDGTLTVAAGTLGNEAVNVEQLNQAIAESGVKYLSANTTEVANRNNDGAEGADAMAIGPAAVAAADSSLAVGHFARVNAGAHHGVAIGFDVSARAENATAIGNDSHTYGVGGVAIGQQAVSRGTNSIVMGTGAQSDPKSGATVDNAIVIGTDAESTADDGIAIGQRALASEVRGIAQGLDAHAAGADAQASGTRAVASGVSSQASGTDAEATGVNAQASGTGAEASGANAIATGTGARGYANDGIALGSGAVSGFVVDVPEDAFRNHGSIAIGDAAISDDLNALALGVSAQARAESATAVGDASLASAEDALAVGSAASATALNAGAFGTNAAASGINALAMGAGASATVQDASAFGRGAQALHVGSVALGSNAVTAAPVGTPNMEVDKRTYIFAGQVPVATVSVGAAGAERTITHVAAGRISEISTDAINGSQLHGTNLAVEALADDLDDAGTSIAAALGGASIYDPDSHTVAAGLSVGGSTYTTVQDALTYVGQGWNISAEGGPTGNVAPGGSVNFSNADDNILIERDGTNLTFALVENIDLGANGSLTTGNTVIDNAGVSVEDSDGNHSVVGAGAIAVTDAASTTTIGGNAISVGGANPIMVSGDTGTIGGLTNRTVNYPGFADGSGRAATEEQLQLVSQSVSAGWNVSAEGGASDNVAPGATVDFSSVDNNIVIARRGTDLTFGLAENIDLGADGSLTTGNTVVNNAGVLVEDADGNATTVAATGTMVVDADGNRTEVGAGEIAVTDAAGTTTIAGNAILVGGANPIVISGDTGTIGGLTNRTIDYPGFADGSGRAATEDQLALVNQTVNAGWNVSANGANATNVGGNSATGSTVDFSSTNNNIVVTKSDGSNDVTFDLAENIDLGADGSLAIGDTKLDTTGVAIGNDVHLGSTGLVILGGPSVTLDGIHAGGLIVTGVAAGEVSATSQEAVNGSQLHGTTDSIANIIGGNAVVNADGTVTTSDIGGTGYNTIDEAIRSASEAANAGWTATDAGGNAANIGPNGVVNFQGDDNVTVRQTGSDGEAVIEVTLNRDLDVDSITAGNTVIDTDGVRVGDDVRLGDTGLVIEGGPSVTVDGIDAGGRVIGNVAAGVEDTDAVNVGQLNALAGAVVDNDERVTNLENGAAGPFQVSREASFVPPAPTGENSAAGGAAATASGANSTALGNQSVASGENSTAVGQGAQATHDNSVALGQGSVTTVGAQTGYDAAYVGKSDSAGEVNVGNRTISGVAAGMAGTDAVNVNQLNAGVNRAVITANEYTDQRFNQVQGDVWHLNQRVDDLEKNINSGVATAMAMRQAPYVAGATTYYAGFGAYKDQGALGVSLRRTADNGRWSLEGGFSTNRDGAGGYIGVSGVLGSK